MKKTLPSPVGPRANVTPPPVLRSFPAPSPPPPSALFLVAFVPPPRTGAAAAAPPLFACFLAAPRFSIRLTTVSPFESSRSRRSRVNKISGKSGIAFPTGGCSRERRWASVPSAARLKLQDGSTPPCLAQAPRVVPRRAPDPPLVEFYRSSACSSRLSRNRCSMRCPPLCAPARPRG